MKNKDFLFIKNELDNSWVLCNYLDIVKVGDENLKEKDFHKVKIMFNDLVVTITDSIGFAYLVSWWADGSISEGKANELSKLCQKYNGRF